MNDMSSVIIAKSDQWNADDFVDGPRTFTIEDVSIKPGTEQPVQIKLAGSSKVYRPCKTVSRVLVAAWGADANKYRGRSLTLYTDPSVTWGGMKVGGIRVSHMTDLSQPLVIALQEKKGSRKMTTVQPLKMPKHDEPRSGLDVADSSEFEGYTLDAARADIAAATTTDELGRVWRSHKMKPHREALLAEKDERKALLEDLDAEVGDEFAEG